MSLNRYAKRRDANEREVIDALLAVGCSVLQTDGVDLVVGYRGVNYLIEVKDGSKPKSERKLTKAQLDLRQSWRGQYSVVESVDQALCVISGMGPE